MKQRAMDWGYRARRLLLRVLRLRTRGVKVIAVTPDGSVMLIRNTYGRSDQWTLPGGGLARGETPRQAAARELREETGLHAGAMQPFATYRSVAEGKRDTVHLFVTQVTGTPVPDGREVAEVRAFAPVELPAAVSPATRRRIKEWLGAREVTGRW